MGREYEWWKVTVDKCSQVGKAELWGEGVLLLVSEAVKKRIKSFGHAKSLPDKFSHSESTKFL